MNKSLLLCALVVSGTAATPQNSSADSGCAMVETLLNEQKEVALAEIHIRQTPMVRATAFTSDPESLDLDEIIYLEEESPVDLGFNTADYLPEEFDPYEVYVDLDSFIYIEEEDITLGFDTSVYLPEGFDPYASPSDISGFNYMEEEDALDPYFDTAQYLPEGFDPFGSYKEGSKRAPASDDSPAEALHSRRTR